MHLKSGLFFIESQVGMASAASLVEIVSPEYIGDTMLLPFAVACATFGTCATVWSLGGWISCFSVTMSWGDTVAVNEAEFNFCEAVNEAEFNFCEKGTTYFNRLNLGICKWRFQMKDIKNCHVMNTYLPFICKCQQKLGKKQSRIV
jgi:hypothetical protein